MEMNEILNGLNSCGYGDEDSHCAPDCNPGCNTSNTGNAGFGGGCWIWILLILFYSCSGSKNKSSDNCCCCVKKKDHCCDMKEKDYYCCESKEAKKGGCSSYLFLLVILFLCNSNGKDCGNGGLGGLGNLFGCC